VFYVCGVTWCVCSRHRRHKRSLSRSPSERESGSKRARYYHERERDIHGSLQPDVSPIFMSDAASLAATAAAGFVSSSSLSDAMAATAGPSVSRGGEDSYAHHRHDRHRHHHHHRKSRGLASEHRSHKSHRDAHTHTYAVGEDVVASGMDGVEVWSGHGPAPTFSLPSSSSMGNNHDGKKETTRAATPTVIPAAAAATGNPLTKP
jgi:hypothetical protein